MHGWVPPGCPDQSRMLYSEHLVRICSLLISRVKRGFYNREKPMTGSPVHMPFDHFRPWAQCCAEVSAEPVTREFRSYTSGCIQCPEGRKRAWSHLLCHSVNNGVLLCCTKNGWEVKTRIVLDTVALCLQSLTGLVIPVLSIG